MIGFTPRLDWKNKSEGKPETVVFKDDLLRYENALAALSDLVDTGRLSDPALEPAFRPVRSALDSGRSAAIQLVGDSTGDWDGVGTETWGIRMMRRIAASYPGHRVVVRNWNTTINDYGVPVVIQPAGGIRGAKTTTRSLRHVTPTPPQFTTGTIDVRGHVTPTTLTPAATGVITGRSRKSVSGTLSNDLQFELMWNTAGNLVFHHSTDGAAFISDRVSTAPIPAVVGTPIHVRAVYEHTVGAPFTVKFYTSPDGVTWTQLGTTVTGGNVDTLAIWTASAGSFFEIGGRGWQPVANPFPGTIHSVEIRDGIQGPLLAPATPEKWQRYTDAATTFTGSPTLTLLNASRSGTDMSYHLDPVRQARQCSDYGQVLVIFNDSHNEVGKSGAVEWTTPYSSWVDSVKAKLPSAAVAVTLQNPHTSAWANEAAYGYSHVQRLDELRSLASVKGWGLVDIYAAFVSDPRGVSALIATGDGLHPNSVGYELGGRVAARRLGL